MSDIRQGKQRVDRVVICGSMSCYQQMLECQQTLRDFGVPSVAPVPEGAHTENLSPERFRHFKSVVSAKWLKEIRRNVTFGILVVNEPKRQQNNYIGANTFAEIAVAFCAGKAIYLLRSCFSVYEDELRAWGAVELDGDRHELALDFAHVMALRDEAAALRASQLVFDLRDR